MVSFDPLLLDKYAELAIKVGVNLQEGQRLLLVGAPVQLAPLIRLITKHAYLAGARYVDVEWADEKIELLRLQHGSPESLEEFPEWRAQLNVDYFEAGDATLAVIGGNPDLMVGQDPAALEKLNKIRAENMFPVSEQISANASNWSMIAGSTPAWAQKVFPDLPCHEAEVRLWDTIFDVCRVRTADPVAAWRQHIQDLQAREDYLNARRYRRLHFKAPGTNLKLGLPAAHRWLSGGLTAKNGIHAVVNLPTEEVFTMPIRHEIDGVVSSTKPLSSTGNVIEDFALTFENGRVVKATAGKGQAALDTLLNVDEGARSLGEVALVPHKSPVSQSELLFYNILFDENASNHLALGAAYRFSMEGSDAMSEEAFFAAGGNNSMIHVDFMFGSAEMDVDGLTDEGMAEPVMRGGEWAFDA